MRADEIMWVLSDGVVRVLGGADGDDGESARWGMAPPEPDELALHVLACLSGSATGRSACGRPDLKRRAVPAS